MRYADGLSAAGQAGRLIGVWMLSATLAGCAVFGVGRDAAVAPLDVPEAPPRVVAEFPHEPEPNEEPSTLEETVADGPAIDEAPTDDATSLADLLPRPVPSTPVEEPTPQPEANRETPPLELTTDPEEDVDAALVRRGLRSTAQILEEIDQTALDAAGRTQRDTAQRFLSQATTALHAGNVTFAHYLTEKAETLARDLQNR